MNRHIEIGYPLLIFRVSTFCYSIQCFNNFCVNFQNRTNHQMPEFHLSEMQQQPGGIKYSYTIQFSDCSPDRFCLKQINKIFKSI